MKEECDWEKPNARPGAAFVGLPAGVASTKAITTKTGSMHRQEAAFPKGQRIDEKLNDRPVTRTNS